MINSKTSIEELVNFAKEQTGKLDNGELFLVKDLFYGYEWNRISRGDRIKLGVIFNGYVHSENSDISEVKKTPQNQWIYKKLK